jgi:hypothetical protein
VDFLATSATPKLQANPYSNQDIPNLHTWKVVLRMLEDGCNRRLKKLLNEELHDLYSCPPSTDASTPLSSVQQCIKQQELYIMCTQL